MIFGFGGKKRFYFKVFDDAARRCGLHGSLVEDAFRLTVWRWVEADCARKASHTKNAEANDCLYHGMEAVARLAAFAMLEPEESRDHLSEEEFAAVAGRLEQVLDQPERDGLDNQVIRLVLATGRANRSITDRVELDVEG